MPDTASSLPPGISVVIPVYNSEPILPELVPELERALSELGQPFETILVNDASQDGSWEVIEELSASHSWVRGINLMRNYGQHNALLCGIREAKFDTIVTMDDDLQHPPAEIPKLLDKLGEGFDVVYGPPLEMQHGLLRNLASWITKLALSSSVDAAVARDCSAFRAFRTRLRRAFENYRSPFVSIDVLLTWATTRFAAVPVRHDPRKVGQSNYTFRKLVAHALNMLTGYTTWPLQIASFVGFGFTLFGILVLVYVVGRYLYQGTEVAGFPFLASTIAIFSGAILFTLGITGEYLARMHLRSMERPTYTVRDCTGGSAPPPGQAPERQEERES